MPVVGETLTVSSVDARHTVAAAATFAPVCCTHLICPNCDQEAEKNIREFDVVQEHIYLIVQLNHGFALDHLVVLCNLSYKYYAGQ